MPWYVGQPCHKTCYTLRTQADQSWRHHLVEDFARSRTHEKVFRQLLDSSFSLTVPRSDPPSVAFRQNHPTCCCSLLIFPPSPESISFKILCRILKPLFQFLRSEPYFSKNRRLSAEVIVNCLTNDLNKFAVELIQRISGHMVAGPGFSCIAEGWQLNHFNAANNLFTLFSLMGAKS